MDIFKLGVRDVFGIVFPGAVLLLVIIYVFWSLSATLGLPALDVSSLKDQGFLLSIVFFVASYVLGYLLRLGTANRVDKESSEYLLKRWWKDWKEQKEKQVSKKSFSKQVFEKIKWVLKRLLNAVRRKEDSEKRSKQDFEEGFEQLWNDVRWGGKDFKKRFEQLLKQMKQKGVSDDSDTRTAFDEWLWRADSFPYPICCLRQGRFKYTDEIKTDEIKETNFFDQYKHCMGLVSDSHWITGTQFFNYCKLVISQSKEDNALREEINVAESNTRFLAGTYSALKVSFWILLIPLISQLPQLINGIFLQIIGISITDATRIHLASLLSTSLVMLGSLAAQIHIKRHYRRLRLREADTVYDAFYLVCKKKDHDAKPPRDPETIRSTFSEDR